MSAKAGEFIIGLNLIFIFVGVRGETNYVYVYGYVCV